MVSTVIPPNRTTRLDMAGTDTLVEQAGASFSVSSNAQTVRFTGPTNGASIDNAGQLLNTNAAGRAIRVETGVGASFTASITNRATGTIQAVDDAIGIQAGSVTAGTLTIDNAGSITTTDGQAIDLAGGTGAFVANVTNTGTLGSANNDGVRFGSIANMLINSGIINGGTTAAYAQGADGVQFDVVGSGGTVTNQLGGAISGDRHGINATTGTFVTVTNDATSTITGRNGSGVGLDGSGSVTNYGIITGAFSNSAGSDINGTNTAAANGGGPDGVNDGDGDGIDIDGQATVDNYGTIQGTGAGGSGSDGRLNTSEAIAAGGGTFTNRSGGIIQGLGLGILIDDSSTGPAPFATFVTNLGSITGTNSYAIRLIGTQADTVDNGGTISGGGGVAMLLGGGDDTLRLRNGSVITGTTDAEAGTADALDYANWTTTGVTVSLLAGTATGTGGIAGFEIVTGSGQDDVITGDAGANGLSGGAGADTIAGGGGDDLLDGGAGVDTASYATAASAVFVGLLLQGGAQNTQGAGTDTLSNFENVTGSAFDDTIGGDNADNVLTGNDGNDMLFGGDGGDSLIGGAGNDTLYGGAGNDLLTGGAGNDVYVVDALLDVVSEGGAGQGVDSVFVTVSGWTASANLEAVYLYAAAATLTGSGFDDVLVADTGGSTLFGAGGNDTLWGQGDNDGLTGGAGADVLRGGGGSDTLSGGAGGDKLVGGTGADVFAFDLPSFGTDEIFDFNRGEGDRIDMRGSGITSLAGFAFINTDGTNTQLVATGGTINLYGLAAIQESDFIFS